LGNARLNQIWSAENAEITVRLRNLKLKRHLNAGEDSKF